MGKLDLNKPVQTRDGRPVRIVCTDKKGDRPILALILDGNKEIMCDCYLDGRTFEMREAEFDLVNVPERITRWLNIYRDFNGELNPGSLHPTKEWAMQWAMRQTKGAGAGIGEHFATIKIEFTEGECK